MKKVLIKTVVFLLLIVPFFIGMEHVCDLLYPSNDITRNWQSFYALDENSVDLLVVGSSHAYSSFNRQIFEETLGLRTYILASNSQNVTQTYFNVKEALKYQKPKVILLEAFSINSNSNWQTNNSEVFDRDWKKESNIDGMRMGLTKVEAVMAQYTPQNWAYALFRICRCHQNWKDAAQIQNNADFLREGVKNYEPFRPSQTEMSNEVMHKYEKKKASNRKYEISEVNQKYFRKLAELCRDNQIELYVVMAPMYDVWIEKTNYSSKYEKISTLVQSEGVAYLDCNLEYNKIGLSSKDFEDAYSSFHHLNVRGAEKVSRFVAHRWADEKID